MPDTQYPDWNKLLRDAIREFPARPVKVNHKEIDKAIWKAFVWTVFVRLFTLLVVKKGVRQ